MSRTHPHTHESLAEGGKLDPGDALRGGLDGVGGGTSSDPDLSGLVQTTQGGIERLEAHGSAGSTETLDLASGNWHSLTLDDDCTVTVQGFTAAAGCSALVKVTQDGTGGWAIVWDSDIVFASGADDQPAQSPGDVSWFVLASDEGDGTIYGFPVGGSGGDFIPQGGPLTADLLTGGFFVKGDDLAGGTGAFLETQDGDGVAGGGDARVSGGDGAVGATGGAATLQGGDGDAGGWDGARVVAGPGVSGNGLVAIFTDGSFGTFGQPIVSNGANKAVWGALTTATPLIESGAGAVGTGVKSSREDHVHPAAAGGGSGLGPLLIDSAHSSPIVFGDILQASDFSDLLYGSAP